MKKLIFLLVMMLAVNAIGATRYWPYKIRGDDIGLDSVLLEPYNVTDASYDTTKLTTFPANDSLSIDDSKLYKLFYHWCWTGDTSCEVSSEVIYPVSNIAGVDSITGAIADANKDNFKYDGAGSGGWTRYYKVLDTGSVGDPDIGSDVFLHAYIPGGSKQGQNKTNLDGIARIVGDSGTYEIRVKGRGYAAEVVQVTDTADGDTLTINGYDMTAVNTCNTYGYVYDIQGNPAQYARVEVTLLENTRDTCRDRAVGAHSRYINTDVDGYWYIDLTYSSCLQGVRYQGRRYISNHGWSKPVIFTVPDSVEYRVTL